jgi:CRP/FNR family cyclic AMP-dependent transcriptional regulator
MGGFDRPTEDTHYLSQIPCFRACSTIQLSEIDRIADRSAVPSGQVLVQEGAAGRELFIIVSGRAMVTCRGLLVNLLGPGDYFGELAAIESGSRGATVTATSDLDVLMIGPDEFSTLVAEIPSFRAVLLQGMAQRIRTADDTIEDMRLKIGELPKSRPPAGAGIKPIFPK